MRKFCKLQKLKRAGESFPLDFQAILGLSMTTGAGAVARGRALGAAGGKPPRMRGAAAAAPQ
ncbi:MAG: hypothetical protein ABSF90_00290 [Syntrophobacteraceae bacterium]